MRSKARRHVPVLLEEVLIGLRVRSGGVYLDGTLGDGGHSFEILSRCPEARIIGLDRDPAAVKRAVVRLEEFGKRAVLMNMDFRRLDKALDEAGVGEVDGILLDLGVSSTQLEEGGRGFSFSREGPLDMRMDPNGGISAEEVVNTWSRGDLAKVLFRYGEEKLAEKVAGAIVREREQRSIRTTLRLAEIVASVPGMRKVRNIHPATRTFQALRILVNDELEAVRESIPLGVDRLVYGGRMAVISFHSLEDRIVKRSFRILENPCRCPKETPMCVCGERPRGKIITRRPVVPRDEEVDINPRSRSARLRIFETVNSGCENQGHGNHYTG